jgi:hypothetical protein
VEGSKKGIMMLLSEELLLNGKSRSMTEPYRIKVASDFSSVPFGRYRDDGPHSGEVFREDVLIPALKANERVVIDIDGVEGLPSSFWEEALGGLVRRGSKADEIREKLDIECRDSDLQVYVRLGWKYVDEAAREASSNGQ